MISKSARRAILRWVHLVLSIPIAGYIYGNPSDVQQYAGGVRIIFFPAMILSGFWMWQGYVFAIIGAALWLGAFHFLGFGAAILIQIALFITMKIWLVMHARKVK